MTSTINTGRVIQGGLLAGFVINLISMLNNSLIVGGRIMAAQQAGFFIQEPRFAFMPVWLIVMFLVGIGLVWLYAAVRTRLGPGPGTALTVGIVVVLFSLGCSALKVSRRKRFWNCPLISWCRRQWRTRLRKRMFQKSRQKSGCGDS